MIKITIGEQSIELKTIKVTIWNEYIAEKKNPQVASVYPNGIHHALAQGLTPYGFHIRTATFEEPEHGLTKQLLHDTNVLIWWGHFAHEEVSDEIVERVYERVLGGMGLIVLHSGHFSKIFKKLMGTTCALNWRESGDQELLWVVNPAHPITAGIGPYIKLSEEEMYGEFFDIPAPDELVFVGWFDGGEVFRSGCTFYRRLGKIFYFQPGHETHPTYYHKEILHVIANAVKWAAAPHGTPPTFSEAKPIINRKNDSP